MKRLTLGCTLLLLLSINSCKKDEPVISKNMQFITNGTWIQISTSINGEDYWEDIPECIKDDTYTYKKNLTLIEDEGATKCISTDPQTNTYKWNFIDNETKIFDGEDTIKIITLTEKEFIYEYDLDGDIVIIEHTRL